MDRDKLIFQIRESQAYLKTLSDNYDKLVEAAINSNNTWYVGSVAYVGTSLMAQVNRTSMALINALSQEDPAQPLKETQVENESN
jgi:hypothetical protein